LVSGQPPEHPAQPEQESRRKFLTAFIGVAAGAVAVALAAPLAIYFLTPLSAGAVRRTVTIASTKDIPVGSPTFVAYEEAKRDAWLTTTESKGAWIVTKDGKDFVIYDPHCTHLGCGYFWDAAAKTFNCPCHGGFFDIDGNVIAGPPPRPLDRMAFTIDGDSIQLIVNG
jgi:menaquinol-cytochrome c reductase iron-sulfur subunit